MPRGNTMPKCIEVSMFPQEIVLTLVPMAKSFSATLPAHHSQQRILLLSKYAIFSPARDANFFDVLKAIRKASFALRYSKEQQKSHSKSRR